MRYATTASVRAARHTREVMLARVPLLGVPLVGVTLIGVTLTSLVREPPLAVAMAVEAERQASVRQRAAPRQAQQVA
jgi:hypothetical protein